MVITRYKIVIVTKQTKEAEPLVICKENNKDIIYLPQHRTIHIIPVLFSSHIMNDVTELSKEHL